MAKRKPNRKKVYESLLEQLSKLGASVSVFENMLEDYMAMWDIKESLVLDIKQRGVTYKDVSSVGIEMQKNNPSVKELVQVNRQMLLILKELGLSTENAGGGEDDEL